MRPYFGNKIFKIKSDLTCLISKLTTFIVIFFSKSITKTSFAIAENKEKRYWPGTHSGLLPFSQTQAVSAEHSTYDEVLPFKTKPALHW